MRKETLKDKIIMMTVAAVGLAGIITIASLDRITAKTQTVKNVESKLITIGYPSPFTSWKAYKQHKLTFEDNTIAYAITRDYDYPFVKKLLGYKTPHPKEGDQYSVSPLSLKVIEKQ